MNRTGPTNENLQKLIRELKLLSYKDKSNLWGRIADDLEKPSRQRREVNLARINVSTKENEIVVVPGKVLGTGSLDHKVTLAAWKFSEQAREKVASVKGSTLTIEELMKKKPKSSEVRVIG